MNGPFPSLLLLSLLLLASPAKADAYKCRQPDGRTVISAEPCAEGSKVVKTVPNDTIPDAERERAEREAARLREQAEKSQSARQEMEQQREKEERQAQRERAAAQPAPAAEPVYVPVPVYVTPGRTRPPPRPRPPPSPRVPEKLGQSGTQSGTPKRPVR
jgi:hypothetical protein